MSHLLVGRRGFELSEALPGQDAEAAAFFHVLDVRLGIADADIDFVEAVFRAAQLLTLMEMRNASG